MATFCQFGTQSGWKKIYVLYWVVLEVNIFIILLFNCNKTKTISLSALSCGWTLTKRKNVLTWLEIKWNNWREIVTKINCKSVSHVNGLELSWCWLATSEMCFLYLWIFVTYAILSILFRVHYVRFFVEKMLINE